MGHLYPAEIPGLVGRDGIVGGERSFLEELVEDPTGSRTGATSIDAIPGTGLGARES